MSERFDPTMLGPRYDADEDRERTEAEWRDRQEPEEFEAYSNGEPITVAIRVCGTCRVLLGHDIWRGTDAHPEAVCETAGLCVGCYEEMEAEITKLEDDEPRWGYVPGCSCRNCGKHRRRGVE